MVLETLAMVLKTSMASVFRSHCTRVAATSVVLATKFALAFSVTGKLTEGLVELVLHAL